jgi:hypothetical protein
MSTCLICAAEVCPGDVLCAGCAKSRGKQFNAKHSSADVDLMRQYGITFDGERYCLREYRYDQLQYAVEYALKRGWEADSFRSAESDSISPGVPSLDTSGLRDELARLTEWTASLEASLQAREGRACVQCGLTPRHDAKYCDGCGAELPQASPVDMLDADWHRLEESIRLLENALEVVRKARGPLAALRAPAPSSNERSDAPIMPKPGEGEEDEIPMPFMG